MTKITDIPAIRFKGFSDTWEQRKLGEIGSVSMCRRIFKEQTSENGEIPFYKIGTFGGEADAFISRELFEEYKAKYQYPKKGDILISASGSIGRTVVFTGKNEYFQDSNIVWLNHDKHLDNSFLKCFYSIVKWAGIEGSTIKRLYNDNILNTAITLPSVEEQQKIGAYFENLDNLITLHQRKYDKLTNVKKSMLEKMFPQNGSNVPEIRFKGFTEAWEQRKLGEVAKYRNGKAHENCIDESGKYIVVNSKFVSTNGTVIKHSNMQNEPLAQNEIAFVLSDVPNGRAIARTFLVEENDKYTLNQRIAGITSSENTYPYFLHILMNRHPYFLAFDDGVKQTNLSVSDVLNFETYYPEYEEQKQIGEYFRNLDRLITLHQRELEKLKKLKKACLEKMFV